MLASMFKSGLTILRHPSIETIKAHMQPNLRWGLIYQGLALLLASTITVLYLPIQEAANAAIMQQLLPSAPDAIAPTQASSLFPLWVFWFIYLAVGAFGVLYNYGLLYGVGRAFGGTGSFATFVYVLALIYVPITLINIIINLASISLLACLTLPIIMGLSGYFLYLEYLVLRATLDLPKDKAILTIVIPIAILVVVACCIVGVWFAVVFSAVQNMS